MQILSVVLSGYKRLALNNIKYIKITPENKIQLLIGSNGSGKSSLLKELSPLPGIPSEFLKDGYKIIELTHNNSHYLLKNTFGSGNSYVFIKDEIELYSGSLVTMFKELVRKEFNITTEIHELMLGILKFHTMSVSERRKWFTYISDSDYTYAVQYFNRLKEQLRDIQGAVKLNQTRLIQESEKLLTESEEAIYKKEIVELNLLLATLLELKNPIYVTTEETNKKINFYEQQISNITKQLIKFRSDFLNVEKFSSTSDIETSIIDTRTSIQTTTLAIESLCTQIQNNQNTLDALNKVNLDSVNDIDRTINEFSDEYNKLAKQIKFNFHFNDNKQAQSALFSLYDILIEIATSIEPNINSKYSKENFNLINDNLKQATQKLSIVDEKQIRLINKKKELEHFKEHNKVECPKCSHVWHTGYSEKVYSDLILAIDSNTKDLISSKEDVLKYENQLVKIKEYIDHYRSFLNIVRSWPILDPLWNYLINSSENYSIILNNPRQILSIIDDLKRDLVILLQQDGVDVKLKDSEKLKKIVSENKELDFKNIEAILETQNKELLNLNKRLQVDKTHLSKLRFYRETSLSILNLTNELETAINNRSIEFNTLLSIARVTALNTTIQTIQLELSKREQVISKIDIQKALVDNLSKQLEEHSEKAYVLKLALKELSPTEGLIAKGLSGFINQFVGQINNFIKKIWLYPLELIPVTSDDNDSLELDYKFSVKINDYMVISDITKASSAMKEVIDLAFKIVSMRYLGLHDAPLYLDELGASFDKAHRSNIYYLIQNISNNSNFSQIYIISHYEEMYGSFKNNDIILLCDANMPESKNTGFNKTVQIS